MSRAFVYTCARSCCRSPATSGSCGMARGCSMVACVITALSRPCRPETRNSISPTPATWCFPSLPWENAPPPLPALESAPRQRYSVYALAISHLLIPHQRLVRNSCSVCATKGGVWTGTPICGVLLLDPSLYSPLELVKSSGDVPGSRGRHH